MSYKLAFRFERTSYSPSQMRQHNPEAVRRLQTLMDSKAIIYSHIYEPNRNSIKVIYPNENELDKVFKYEQIFKNENFTPKMSLELKASRTVFCTNLDPTIIGTFDNSEIKQSLVEQGYKVKEVYITRSRKAFKIEMKYKKEVRRFLKDMNSHIGQIRIAEASKEQEVDPTIKQCWECGQIDPNHSTQECPGPKICLKCGDNSHKWHACTIPADPRKQTEAHKRLKFCATCNKKTDHTTLDHRQCPKKRDKIRERARLAREKSLEIQELQKRDVELIQQTINLTDKSNWPELNETQQQKITTIITLAMIDEAFKPGIFERKLEEGCQLNGLPTIKYKMEPQSAKAFMETMVGYCSKKCQCHSKNNLYQNITKIIQEENEAIKKDQKIQTSLQNH